MKATPALEHTVKAILPLLLQKILVKPHTNNILI